MIIQLENFYHPS